MATKQVNKFKYVTRAELPHMSFNIVTIDKSIIKYDVGVDEKLGFVADVKRISDGSNCVVIFSLIFWQDINLENLKAGVTLHVKVYKLQHIDEQSTLMVVLQCTMDNIQLFAPSLDSLFEEPLEEEPPRQERMQVEPARHGDMRMEPPRQDPMPVNGSPRQDPTRNNQVDLVDADEPMRQEQDDLLISRLEDLEDPYKKVNVRVRIVSIAQDHQTPNPLVGYKPIVVLDESEMMCFYIFKDKEHTIEEDLLPDRVYLLKNVVTAKKSSDFSPYGNCQLNADNDSSYELAPHLKNVVPRFQYNFRRLSSIKESDVGEYVNVLVKVVSTETGNLKNKRATKDVTLSDQRGRTMLLWVWGDHAAVWEKPNGTVLAILHAKVAKPKECVAIQLHHFVITAVIDNFNYQDLPEYKNWFKGN